MSEEKIIILINKLTNSNINNLNEMNNIVDRNGYYFFKILNDEVLKFVDKIHYIFLKSMAVFYNKKVRNKLNIDIDEYFFLNALYLIKSFEKDIIFKDIDYYLSSDIILNSHASFEKKFWMYSNSSIYPYCKEFKKEIFKVYCILAHNGIIIEKKRKDGFKTPKEWSIGEYTHTLNNFEKFKISYTSYKLINIEKRFFLRGSFFVLFEEIFKENTYSNLRFELSDIEFLKKVTELQVYFDEEAFNEIYEIYREENVLLKLNKIYIEMSRIKEDRDVLVELNKENYLNKCVKKIIADINSFKFVDNNIAYKVFVYNWLNLNFKNVDWLNYNFDIVWNKFSIEIFKKKNIKNEDLLNVLNNLRFDIYEIEKIANLPVQEISLDKIEFFVANNLSILLKTYRKLGLMEEFSIDYSAQMNEIREYEWLWVEKQKEVSRLYEKLKLDNINSIKNEINNKQIFFLFFFDFRGRFYFNSQIGMTNFKISRYIFHYGWYTQNEIAKLDKINIPEIHKYNKLLNDLSDFLCIRKASNAIKESIFWVLLAVGKEFIDKKKIYNTLEEILDEGVKQIQRNSVDIVDKEKRIILMHYKRILVSYNNEKILKRFIHKDATASFIQNTIRIVGAKNEKSLEYANLKSMDKWYDTYAFALEKWKDSLDIRNNSINLSNKEISVNFLKYFIRKTIKKPIMTGPYEATFLTKWDYFRKDVFKEFDEKIMYNSSIGILFKNFMLFLDTFWVDYFLAENSDVMISHIINKESGIVLGEKSKTNLTYFLRKKKKIDLYIKIPDTLNIIRKTKLYYEIDKENIDKKKMNDSIKANWVHFSDALLCRQINEKLDTPLLTIHDCFLVDPLNVSNFIIIANKAFKDIENLSIAKDKDLLYKIKSIFIFL